MPSPRWSIHTPRSARARRRRVTTASGSIAASSRLRCRSSCAGGVLRSRRRGPRQGSARSRPRNRAEAGPRRSRRGTRYRAPARIPAFVTSSRPAHSAAHTWGWWVSISACSRSNDPDLPRPAQGHHQHLHDLVGDHPRGGVLSDRVHRRRPQGRRPARAPPPPPRARRPTSRRRMYPPGRAPSAGSPGSTRPTPRRRSRRVQQHPVVAPHRHTHLKHQNPHLSTRTPVRSLSHRTDIEVLSSTGIGW